MLKKRKDNICISIASAYLNHSNRNFKTGDTNLYLSLKLSSGKSSSENRVKTVKSITESINEGSSVSYAPLYVVPVNVCPVITGSSNCLFGSAVFAIDLACNVSRSNINTNSALENVKDKAFDEIRNILDVIDCVLDHRINSLYDLVNHSIVKEIVTDKLVHCI